MNFRHVSLRRLLRSTVRRSLSIYWKVNCLVTAKGHFLERTAINRDLSHKRMVARYFWMRSAICRSPYKPNYCVCLNRVLFDRSVVSRSSVPISVWYLPHTSICWIKYAKKNFAKISITVYSSIRSPCRVWRHAWKILSCSVSTLCACSTCNITRAFVV
ncbi:Uncharacterised protein [Vibrio cholerae]|nr:Uncharacterised protein [Vibrio cholerae]CSA95442.1 Uncharacterised protein [Vibrio cholerae]CSB37682.1 Uncharacterised protein [Vibrio cholerae]CSB41507.1 Uncharacterised protein [Vibrio cholerae]